MGTIGYLPFINHLITPLSPFLRNDDKLLRSIDKTSAQGFAYLYSTIEKDHAAKRE
jgi:hypothetical protein